MRSTSSLADGLRWLGKLYIPTVGDKQEGHHVTLVDGELSAVIKYKTDRQVQY